MKYNKNIIVFFLCQMYPFSPGKCAMFLANVSEITWQMCLFPGKCAILDSGKCAKGKLIISI